MSLPEVRLNIQDPGLGIVAPSAGKTQVKLGVCQRGTANTVYAAGSVNAARAAIGSGPMLDAVAQVLGVAGGPVMMVPVLPVSYGTVTASLALTGSGTGTVSASRGPEEVVAIKIGTGGSLGTATFQTKIGSGAYGPPVTTVNAPPWSYPIPGQAFTTAVFAAGTYVADDVYTLNLDGTVTRTGSGTATLLDGSNHSPVDNYELWVKISTSGGLGAGGFQYSLDGGNNYSGAVAVPSGGKYVIPGTGIVLTFAGTFTVDDLYKGVATAPGFTGTEVTAAITALLANPSEWGFLHLIGTAASAAAAATMTGVVGAQMAVAEAAFRYVFGLTECPQSEGDSAIKVAFAAYADGRMAVGVGEEDIISPLTGRRTKRNKAWSYAARLSAIKLSSHPGQVATADGGGPLKNVMALYRDESATPGLDEARFVTARTLIGQPGYFVTRGRMMAPPGSDFSNVMNRRVMDRACTVARAAFLQFLNANVRIDPVTKHIDERDAQDIEAVVGAKLEAALIDEDEASAVSVAVSREDNLLSSSTLNVEVSVVPKGYLETIKVSIGFKNPALQATS